MKSNKNPAPGEEEAHVSAHAAGCLGGKWLCRKGPGVSGRQQANNAPLRQSSPAASWAARGALLEDQ